MLPLVTASFLLGLLEPGPALGTHQRVLARLIRREPPHGAGDPLHTTMVLRNVPGALMVLVVRCIFHGCLPPSPWEGCRLIHVKPASQSMGKLPPSPREACQPVHGKAATQST